MGRGLPDDSNIVKEGALYGLDDLGELAARLGSPVNYIRFGDVYMLDEFDCGLGAWGNTIRGVAGYVRLTGTHLRSKGTCLHVNTGTGANPDVTVWRYVPVPACLKMGFGLAFAFENALIDLQLGMYVTLSELQYRFAIKIDTATNHLYYRDNLGGWVEFDDTPIGGFQWLFHLSKLVVNLQTQKYVRFYFNERSYDLSAHSCQAVANPGIADRCECQVIATGVALADGDLYLDDTVATQNEV